MIENKEDLAVLMTVEQGKPLAEARGEVSPLTWCQRYQTDGPKTHPQVLGQSDGVLYPPAGFLPSARAPPNSHAIPHMDL